MSSVVELNFIKVKIVERSCVECCRVRLVRCSFFPLDIPKLTHVHFENFSNQNCGKKGCAKQELFKILQYKQKILVGHPHHTSETTRIFDVQLCENIFNINLFATSASLSSKTTFKIELAIALLYLE